MGDLWPWFATLAACAVFGLPYFFNWIDRLK
jgi:hypothetical protein